MTISREGSEVGKFQTRNFPSGDIAPDGKAPTGKPASLFRAMIREAIFVGDKPGLRGTPTKIKTVGTDGGPPILDSCKILSKPPMIASILLKLILLLGL